MANLRSESWPFSPWTEAYAFEGFLAEATATDSISDVPLTPGGRRTLDPDGPLVAAVSVNLAAIPWAETSRLCEEAGLDSADIDLVLLARAGTLKRASICERRALKDLTVEGGTETLIVERPEILGDQWWFEVELALVRRTGEANSLPQPILERVSFTWARPGDDSSPDIGFLTDAIRKDRSLSKHVLSWADLGSEPACKKGSSVERIWIDAAILKRFEENPKDPGLAVVVSILINQAVSSVLVAGHLRHADKSCQCGGDGAPAAGSLLASLSKRAEKRGMKGALDQFEELAWGAVAQDVSKVGDLAGRWLDSVQDDSIEADDE